VRDYNDKAILAIGFLSLSAVVLVLFNLWYLFGFVIWSILVATVAVGYGRAKSHRPIIGTLIGTLLLYWLVYAGIVWAEQKEGDPILLGGLPLGTAFLFYGLWPMGFVWGILYLLVFPASVLPKDRLDDFLARFGRK
jgi:hypothetical protein